MCHSAQWHQLLNEPFKFNSDSDELVAPICYWHHQPHRLWMPWDRYCDYWPTLQGATRSGADRDLYLDSEQGQARLCRARAGRLRATRGLLWKQLPGRWRQGEAAGSWARLTSAPPAAGGNQSRLWAPFEGVRSPRSVWQITSLTPRTVFFRLRNNLSFQSGRVLTAGKSLRLCALQNTAIASACVLLWVFLVLIASLFS